MTTPPLRLALDVGPLYGHRTGVGVAAQGMLTALSARDDVDLEPYLVSYRATPRSGHRSLPLPGLVASHLWSRSSRPRADRWLSGCDVVHGTNYVAPPTRLPTVVSVYDCWFLRHPELAAGVVRRAGRMLRRVVDRGGWVHATSAATAEQVAELLDTDRVVTIALGPPPAAGEITEPGELASRIAGRPYVVAIGTEERRKGLPLLVEAFARQSEHEHVLVMAGAPGDESDALSKEIGGLPPSVRDRVIRLGPVDERTKRWLLEHAALLAYPSLDEGFGFPILEAQQAATPVVACAVGSIPEVGGDGVHLVTDRTPDSFAAALDRVLVDGVTRLGLLEAGHRNVHRFDWTTTALGLVDLYRQAQETT